MDEVAWVSCDDPEVMLEFLGDWESRRKLRLWACACCRRVPGVFWTPSNQRAIEAAEQFTDGLLDGNALQAATVGCQPDEPVIYAAKMPCNPGFASQLARHLVGDGGMAQRDSPSSAARYSAECSAQADLLRCIFHPFHPISVNPDWLTWNSGLIRSLARAAYDNRDFPAGTLELDRLLVLADALEEAGCTDPVLLGHLRGKGGHVRGCHVLDALLGIGWDRLKWLADDYEVVAQVAGGWPCVVLQVRDRRDNRLFALKTTPAETGQTPPRQNLLREGQAQAAVRHPGIVQVHGVVEHLGQVGFLLEWMEGGNLAQRLDGTPWPVAQAARLVERVARAAHAVHQRGIVHRDIKPSHILLTGQGEPKLTGFSLARSVGEVEEILDSSTGLDMVGIAGTPRYMAPEQVTGPADLLGPTLDIYALGVVLYELLTGRPPFQGMTLLEILRQVVENEPIPPRRLRPEVPRDLEAICLKCLHKKPNQRYSTAEDLADDLSRFLSGAAIQSHFLSGAASQPRPQGVLRQVWRWCARWLTPGSQVD